MNWIKIIVASIFEVGWVIGLNHADSWWQWALTLIAIYVSFYLLIVASMELPVGTSYAVFVGLGATGVAITDFLLFGQPFTIWNLVFIAVLLAGVIGLKMVTSEERIEEAEE